MFIIIHIINYICSFFLNIFYFHLYIACFIDLLILVVADDIMLKKNSFSFSFSFSNLQWAFLFLFCLVCLGVCFVCYLCCRLWIICWIVLRPSIVAKLLLLSFFSIPPYALICIFDALISFLQHGFVFWGLFDARG